MKELICRKNVLKCIYVFSVFGLLLASTTTNFKSTVFSGAGYLIILGLFIIVIKVKKELGNSANDVYKYFKAWIFSSTQIWICFFLHKSIRPVYDSYTYFFAADNVVSDKNLLSYTEPVRGIVLPLVCSVSKKIFYPILQNEILSYGFFASIVFGLCFAVIFPKILEKITVVQFPLEYLFILPTILCVFWWGLIVYPLSDCWAFCFLAFSLFSVLKVLEASNHPKRLSQFIKIGLWAFGGASAAYAAYNARTVYLYPIIVLGVVFFMKLMITKDIKTIVFAVLVSILGFLFLATPQMIINREMHGKSTPEVLGVSAFSNGISLSVWQCKVGVPIQRYDTYIGEFEKFPQASMYFMDPNGQQLTSSADFQKISTLSGYLRLIIKNPQQMAAVLFRHVLNMLNNCYPETYVLDVQRSRASEITANILFWYIGLLALIWKLKKSPLSSALVKSERKPRFGKWMWERGIWILICIIQSLVIIPSAVEVRFFFPVYMVSGFLILEELVQKKFTLWIKSNWLVFVLGLIFFGGTLNSVWAASLALLGRV